MRYLDTENEIWLPIEEVNGKYEVSNKGNVRNSTSGKILKANLDLMGYPIVILSENVKHAFSTGLAKSNAWSLAKPVTCVETDTAYTSTKEASELTGIHQGNISEVCRGKRKSAGGYTWKYIDTEGEK